MKGESVRGHVVIIPLGASYIPNPDTFIVRQIAKKSYLVEESGVRVDVGRTNQELIVTVCATDTTEPSSARAKLDTTEYLYHSEKFGLLYAFTPQETGLAVAPVTRE